MERKALSEANTKLPKPSSRLPTKKTGIPTPSKGILKPNLKREASTLTGASIKENVNFEPAVKKPSYMRPTASRAAARKSLAKARRSVTRVGSVRSAVARAASPKIKRAPTTARTTTLSNRTTTRPGTSRTVTKPVRAAAPARTRPGTAKTAPPKKPIESKEPDESEGSDDPASRVRVNKDGKLIVKGVDKFNKMERARLVEIVCAEKILECRRNSEMISNISSTLAALTEGKKQTEQEKEKIARHLDTKGMEFESLQEKFEGSEREKKRLKREIEGLEEDLEKANKKIKNVSTERDEIAEESASALRKIKTMDLKLEQAQKEIEQYLTQISDLKDENAEKTKKLDVGDEERRALHEQIQQLKGNIRVFSRVRPLLGGELEKGSTSDHITFEGMTGKGIEIIKDEAKNEKAGFEFDKVFQPSSTQEDVFSEVSQLVRSSLDGYNVCIFAYGQTGSGKTFSMEGPDDITDLTRGIIPRSFDFLMNTIEAAKEKGWSYELEASHLEIYCEELRDLCEDSGSKKLDILASSDGGKHINVQNLSSHKVTNQAQINNLIKRAKKRRATASTNCNERSSRSHSVFVLNIHGYNERTDVKISSCLNLVDLAGSERVKDSGATGQRFEEAKKINGSLSCLSDVIAALGSKSKHIPYRNSKLTYLLRNSLGGNAKTLMIMHLNPNKVFSNESLNTLRFAQKVNNTNIGTAQKVVK